MPTGKSTSQPNSDSSASTNDDDSDEALLLEIEEIINVDPKLLNGDPVAITDDQIDDMLGDLDLSDDNDDLSDESFIEETIVEDTHSDILDEEESRDLEVNLTIAEAMRETTEEGASIDLSATDPVGEIAADKSDSKKPRVRPANPTGPRLERDVSMLPDVAFVLTNSAMTDPTFDLKANRANVMGIRPTQKKVADKFDNLLTSLAADKPPSVYVVACFKALTKGGELSNSDLVTALTESKYTIGTARSQAGQIVNLFTALGIVERKGKMMKLNPDSRLASKLTEVV